MANLGEFLRAGTARARVPGEWDCCAFPCAWALAEGYPDPMREWRGTYTTEADGERIATEGGGLVPLFERGMAEAGVPVAAAPWRPGDVAVISVLGREAGAVYTGERWGFVGPRGLAFARLADDCVLRAWGPSRHG